MTFIEIVKAFNEVEETDLDTHYMLMINANTLQYNVEADLAKATAQLSTDRLCAEANEARVSKTLSPKSVSEGKRLALSEDSVLDSKSKVVDAKFEVDLLTAQRDFLERVYFCCKENLNRQEKKVNR